MSKIILATLNHGREEGKGKKREGEGRLLSSSTIYLSRSFRPQRHFLPYGVHHDVFSTHSLGRDPIFRLCSRVGKHIEDPVDRSSLTLREARITAKNHAR